MQGAQVFKELSKKSNIRFKEIILNEVRLGGSLPIKGTLSEDNLTKSLLVMNLSILIVDIRPGSLSLRIPYCVFFLRNWML